MPFLMGNYDSWTIGERSGMGDVGTIGQMRICSFLFVASFRHYQLRAQARNKKVEVILHIDAKLLWEYFAIKKQKKLILGKYFDCWTFRDFIWWKVKLWQEEQIEELYEYSKWCDLLKFTGEGRAAKNDGPKSRGLSYHMACFFLSSSFPSVRFHPVCCHPLCDIYTKSVKVD